MFSTFRVDKNRNIHVLIEETWCICGGPLYEEMSKLLEQRIKIALPYYPVFQSEYEDEHKIMYDTYIKKRALMNVIVFKKEISNE